MAATRGTPALKEDKAQDRYIVPRFNGFFANRTKRRGCYYRQPPREPIDAYITKAANACPN